MKKEYAILLHLLNKSLHPETALLPKTELADIDWDAVFKEAAHQAVILSVFDAAVAYKSHIPQVVYFGWFQKVSRGLMKNMRVGRAQQELTALLKEHGYPHVILKGEASAGYYPRSDLRHLGDVDFLIDPEKKYEIADLLTENGYARGQHESSQHIDFHKDKVTLEMHYRIPGYPSGQAGEMVGQYIEKLMAFDPEAVERSGDFLAPVKKLHGIVLLLHMQYHMTTEGLGLRHLCDWAAFVDRTAEEDFWNENLLPLLREIGLMKYAAVITKTAARAVGSICPDWAQAEDDLCEAVLHDILTGGNFGRKDALRSRASVMIPKDRNGGKEKGQMARLWTTLHTSTATMYPIVKKVKVLHPVLDIYRVGVYGIRRLTGKRPSFHKMAPLAQERRSVYERLEIFETVNS